MIFGMNNMPSLYVDTSSVMTVPFQMATVAMMPITYSPMVVIPTMQQPMQQVVDLSNFCDCNLNKEPAGSNPSQTSDTPKIPCSPRSSGRKASYRRPTFSTDHNLSVNQGRGNFTLIKFPQKHKKTAAIVRHLQQLDQGKQKTKLVINLSIFCARWDLLCIVALTDNQKYSSHNIFFTL